MYIHIFFINIETTILIKFQHLKAQTLIRYLQLSSRIEISIVHHFFIKVLDLSCVEYSDCCSNRRDSILKIY